MKVIAEFVPRHLEKALDLARHIATFGCLEFTADNIIRMRMIDPAKIIYMDFYITPETYKCDSEFTFGVNLGMFYKLIRSLHNDHSIEIEADEAIAKISQSSHRISHTIVAQQLPFNVPIMAPLQGPVIQVPSKLFQKYVRSLASIAPAVEISYSPEADMLFLESVNTMYRTLYSIPIESGTVEGEFRKRFPVKFLEMAINPSLGDTISLVLGDALRIHYTQPNLQADVSVSAYTEG